MGPDQFPLASFYELLEIAISFAEGQTTRELTFLDLGSGNGRVCAATAMMGGWTECLGIEIVETLHAKSARLKDTLYDICDRSSLCDLDFMLSDFTDASVAPLFARADVIFCYSSALPSIGDQLTEVSAIIGLNAQPGTLVITTDKRVVSDGPWEYESLAVRDVANEEVGGYSTGYVCRVAKSGLQLTQ